MAPLCLAFLCSPARGRGEEQAVIPQSVPLYITVTSGAAMRVGAPVIGELTRAVWVNTRVVFPAGSRVRGRVAALQPAPRDERLKAILNGDLTPLRTPIVDFNALEAAGSEVRLHARARMQQIDMVRLVASPHASFTQKLSMMAKAKFHSEYKQVFAPGKKERALQLIYNQLPFHPQRIWTGTELVADLAENTPVKLPAMPLPIAAPADEIKNSLPAKALVHARLETPLSSDASIRGEAVSAILTEPLFDAQHRVLLQEGAQLEGLVQQVKPARSFGRNGVLRFSFREVRPTGRESERDLAGTLSGAGGSKKENLELDAEGGVQARPADNRFLAPLALGVLAAHGEDDDGGAGARITAANGLGLVARIIAWTTSSRSAATGFGAYGFAKSVYFRFLAKGSAVTFARDTPLEVQLSNR